MGSGAWKVPSRTDAYTGSVDASLFSASLPVHPQGEFNFADSIHGDQSVDGMASDLNGPQEDVQRQSSLEEVGRNHIGSILPGNEEELLAGIMDGFNLSGLPNQMEDLEEYDIFRSGGGMEMDSDPRGNLIIGMSRVSLSDAAAGDGSNQSGLPNSVGTVVGEHPYGEHPSRTLFVRNINSNIEDSELRALFEQYGDIRALYTACKHRGFVMISYYDIRAARNALRALQNRPLRRRKLDIHFSIPKENPSDKDINQGTLVVFNLDPSVSNEELRDIFGTYGEIKEIRATPQKRNHKFIEFYDVRAAEAALRSLNRSDIAGKCIKLEPSRPGGAHRNLSQQFGQELEQHDTRGFQQQLGSPPANSVAGNWIQFSSPFEHTPLHAFCQSPGLGTSHFSMSNHMPGLASILPPYMSNLANIAPNSEDLVRGSHMDQAFINTSSAFPQSHSFPESALSAYPLKVPSFCPSSSHASGVGTSSGSKIFLGSSPPYSEHSNSSAWSTPSSGHPFTSREQGLGIPYSARHEPFFGVAHHHVGSAPPGIALEQNFDYFPESPETSFIDAMPYGCMGLCQNKRHFRRNMDARTLLNGGLAFSEHLVENSSPGFKILSSPRRGATPIDGCLHPGSGTNGIATLAERGRNRRAENSGNPVETKKQYQLDLDKIISGEDTRTTLMIKNIPNKYTSNMLLAVIDESNKGTYDFLYLPIDFKNKCNVGYAFINMVAPLHIISFYQAFNGKKWEKFNSEKVASLAYARIQGKAALVAHFQNSSLMNEDKRCRPIVFNLELVESGNQEIPLADMSMDAGLPNSPHSENAPEGLHEERDKS